MGDTLLMHCFSTSPHLKEFAGHWRISWHFGGHCVGHWTLCRSPSGSVVNRRYKDTRKHPDKYKTDKDQNNVVEELGGHWPLCRSPGGSSWAMSEPAGGTSSNNQSDLRYIIIIPAHRKRQTRQSWYILIALNAATRGENHVSSKI